MIFHCKPSGNVHSIVACPSSSSSTIIKSPSSDLTIHELAASACEHQGATVVSPPTKHVAVVHPPVHVPTRLVPNPESIVPLPQLIAILVFALALFALHVTVDQFTETDEHDACVSGIGMLLLHEEPVPYPVCGLL